MSELPLVKYAGKIREIKIGKPGTELILGGETAYSFYSFEGMNPNPPKLGLQVLDITPEEWAPAAMEPFKDVIGDPVAWAKKCVDEYGADFVALWLLGTDPNGKDLPPEHAAEVAKNVAEAIDVPLIVWGVSSDDKNRETLKAVCEACDGMNLAIGPITENNYRQIGAAAIAYKHVVVANSPIDINLAKQLNILLETLGMPEDRIIIDPTTSSVGYGMEYCYSIMERIRQAALCQNDEKLQYPILNNIAEEVWKVKEAKLSEDQDSKLGNAVTRGINLESITAVSALNAGSDILILRHPETLKHIRKYVSDMMIETDLESMDIDLALTAEAPPAPAAKPAEKPKPAPKAKPKAKPDAEAPPTPEVKPAEKPKPAPKAKPAAKPSADVIPEAVEPPKTVEAPLEEKTADLPKPKPSGDEKVAEKPTRIHAVSLKPPPSVERPSLEEDPEAEVLLAKFKDMDLTDEETDRLKTALSVMRTIQAIEKKVGAAELAGVSLEELDFTSDEIASYHEIRTLGEAFGIIEMKIEEAESTGKHIVQTAFSDEDLNTLRSGFSVLNEIKLKMTRPYAEEEPQEADAFAEKLREMDISNEETDRLRTALSVMRTIQVIEKKVQVAQLKGVSLDELDFTSDEIASYHEIRTLGEAFGIIELKIQEAESTGKHIVQTNFSDEDLKTLRSGFSVLKEIREKGTRRYELAERQEAEAFLEKLGEMNVSDEEIDRLKTALSVLRAIQAVERKVEAAESAGGALEDLDFSGDEIASYDAIRSLGRALGVIESKIQEAESTGKHIVQTNFSDADLQTLRAGFSALREIGLREARPYEAERLAEETRPEETPAPEAARPEDKPLAEEVRPEAEAVEQPAPPEERELVEVDMPEEDLEVLRQMLGLFRGAKRVVLGIKRLFDGEAA